MSEVHIQLCNITRMTKQKFVTHDFIFLVFKYSKIILPLEIIQNREVTLAFILF